LSERSSERVDTFDALAERDSGEIAAAMVREEAENECGGGGDRAERSRGGGGSYVRAAIAVVECCRSTVVPLGWCGIRIPLLCGVILEIKVFFLLGCKIQKSPHTLHTFD